jgi:hypothetical protein
MPSNGAVKQRALAMDGLMVTTSRVDGFEGFRDAVHGSHVDVMQGFSAAGLAAG